MSDVTTRAQPLVRHVLAAIAYRTQKALRGAPGHFSDFAAGQGTRTPVELLRHMTSVLGYSRTFVIGGSYPVRPEPLARFDAEVARFHEVLASVSSPCCGGLPDRRSPLRTLSLPRLTPTDSARIRPRRRVRTSIGQNARADTGVL